MRPAVCLRTCLGELWNLSLVALGEILAALSSDGLGMQGGLVINAAGERFCNELGRRDYVTGGWA